MKIEQISPLTFGPNVSIQKIIVVDTPGTYSEVVNAGVTFDYYTSSSFHYDFQLVGIGVSEASVSYSSSEIDSSDYPLIKRSQNWQSNPDSTLPKIKIKNARGETSLIELDFQQKNAQVFYSNPKSLVDGTYAKYSWDRVADIFSALDDGTPENHKVFSADQTRRQTSIIPHTSLTCHAAGAGGSINNAGGHLRMVAITPRHCLQIGHSGSGGATGWNVRFRDINNNIITRTVQANINVLYSFGVNTEGFNGPKDVRLLVLDQDLPASIEPAQFVGDWFFNYTGSATSGTYSPGAFGFISFNQDTHICPVQAVNPFVFPFDANYQLTLNETLLQGRDFGLGYTNSLSLEGFDRWSYFKENAVLGNWYPERPFHHFTRAGDSGSPIFWPVANNKWAIGYGIISGSMWRPTAINALIAQVNEDLGIVGNYEVEVADSPI